MLEVEVKVFFSIKKFNLYLAPLKTLNTRGGVILTMSFPDNISCLEEMLF